jgi:hypothetical protein
MSVGVSCEAMLQIFPEANAAGQYFLLMNTQFDYVYILKGRAIVEDGTFEELKRCSLVFKELWDHQDEKFNVPVPTKAPVDFQEKGMDYTLPVSAAV